MARPPREPARFPQGIVVGSRRLSGGGRSRRSGELAARFGAELIYMTMTGGKPVDVIAVQSDGADVLVDPGRPVAALVDASAEVDLVIVGSRAYTALVRWAV